jgi:hypothetical protein
VLGDPREGVAVQIGMGLLNTSASKK